MTVVVVVAFYVVSLAKFSAYGDALKREISRGRHRTTGQSFRTQQINVIENFAVAVVLVCAINFVKKEKKRINYKHPFVGSRTNEFFCALLFRFDGFCGLNV